MNIVVLVTYFLAPSMSYTDAIRAERVLCDGAEVSWIESEGDTGLDTPANRARRINGPFSVNCEFEE